MPDLDTFVIGSDEHRGRLIVSIIKAAGSWWGKRSTVTYLEFIEDLARCQPGTIYLSNRMDIVKLLKQRPEIWQQVLPYLDVTCPAIIRSGD